MWLDIFYFILFILGVFQLYFLFNIKDYYTQLRLILIKKVIDPKQSHKVVSNHIVNYFNLMTYLFISFGLLTSLWYIYIMLIIIIIIGHNIELKYNTSTHNSLSNVNINEKGSQIVKYVNISKTITYSITIIRIISLIGFSLMYFHGYF